MIVQSGSTVDGSYSLPLMFAKLPEVNQEGSQWTECEVTDAINLIHQNLSRLNSYLSAIVRVLMKHDSSPQHESYMFQACLHSYYLASTILLSSRSMFQTYLYF